MGVGDDLEVLAALGRVQIGDRRTVALAIFLGDLIQAATFLLRAIEIGGQRVWLWAMASRNLAV